MQFRLQSWDGEIQKTTTKWNPEDKKFCIRDVSANIPGKKHLRTSGKVCDTWQTKDLYDLAINKLKIPLPSEDEFMVYLTTIVRKNRKIKYA